MNYLAAVSGCLLIFTTSGALAAKGPNATPGIQQQAVQPQLQENNPVLMLQSGMDKLLDYLKTEHDEAGLSEFLSAEIAPSFDFTYMAKAAAGPYYRRMSEAQHERLEKKMEQMFLSSMADKLKSYNGQDVVYLPPRFNGFDRTTISALINNPGQYPGRIDFRVHLTSEGWEVYDVTASGQSAIAYYRGYFRQAMRSNRNSGR
jgi:phospholipid transport system substrate-binding protein